MFYVFVKPEKSSKWQEIPNGPFPIKSYEITEARKLFSEEWDSHADPFSGIKQNPSTTARSILKSVVPTLSDFDLGMLSFVVTSYDFYVDEG